MRSRTDSWDCSAPLLFYGEYSEAESRFPSPATWCDLGGRGALRHRGVPPRRAWPAPQRLPGALHRRGSPRPSARRPRAPAGRRGPRRHLAPALRPRRGRGVLREAELLVQRDEYAARSIPRRSSPRSTTGRTSTCRGIAGVCSTAIPSWLPASRSLRSDGHTPGHQSLLVELPQTGPVILVRRRLLLAGARRRRARARRRLEPGAGASLDQAAEDAGPARGGPDLSRPRPRLLADRQAVAGRLPLTAPGPAPLRPKALSAAGARNGSRSAALPP